MRALGDNFLEIVQDGSLKTELAKFEANIKERTTEISGVEVNYYSFGTASKTLVLLPGSTGKSITYFRYLEALAKEYKIITLSYPAVTGMEQMLEVIEGLLDYETIEEYYLFGQSFGGILAQLIAKRNKKKVKGIILAHTNTLTDQIDKKLVKKNISSVKTFKRSINGFSYSRFIKNFAKRISKGVNMADIDNKSFWNDFYVALLLNTSKAEMDSLYNCLLEFWKDYAISIDEFKDWKGKALIIEAETDHVYAMPEKEQMKVLFKRHETYDFAGSSNMAIIKNRELLLKSLFYLLEIIKYSYKNFIIICKSVHIGVLLHLLCTFFV